MLERLKHLVYSILNALAAFRGPLALLALFGAAGYALYRHPPLQTVARGEVATLIQTVWDTLSALSQGEAPPVELTPAVPIKRSVTDDYIVCLEDGKKLKMLKRHLMTAYNMTPGEYRAKWGLKADYPMVAPNYALKRQELARKIGLGRKPRVVAPVPAAKPAARKPRAKKVAA